MTRSGRILVIGGLFLAIWSMGYGLFYAVFMEHQTLGSVGGSLAAAFVHAAERNMTESQAAMESYASANYAYVRQVDAHGHWIGLGLLLFILGVAFGRVGYSEAFRRLLAITLLLGAALFPLGVLGETVSHGPLPKAIAVVGSAMIIGSLAVIAWGFSRAGARASGGAQTPH